MKLSFSFVAVLRPNLAHAQVQAQPSLSQVKAAAWSSSTSSRSSKFVLSHKQGETSKPTHLLNCTLAIHGQAAAQGGRQDSRVTTETSPRNQVVVTLGKTLCNFFLRHGS